MRARNTAEKCAVRIKIGKQDSRIPKSKEVNVCLTLTQRNQLFRGAPPVAKLGCGTFACAYEAVDGQAVKITADADDVSALLRAQGLPGVVRLTEAYRLKKAGSAALTGEPVPLYGVRGEKLLPVPVEIRPILTLVVNSPHMLHEYDLWRGDRAKFRLSDDFRRVQDDDCENLKHEGKNWLGYKVDIATCKRVAREVETIFESLAQRRIRWADIHAANFGVTASGRLKAQIGRAHV